MNDVLKIGTSFVLLMSSILIMACGNDKSPSAAKTAENGNAVETYDDLLNCSKNRDGVTVVVRELGKSYTCLGGTWSEAAPSYKSEDDLPICSSTREGEIAYVEKISVFVTCVGTRWISNSEKKDDSEKENSSSSSGSVASSESLDGSESMKQTSSSSIFCWDDECSGLISSSSVKDENIDGSVSSEESNSSIAKIKQVEFEDGILWKPNYGKRVRTFAGDADEYTFLNDSTGTGWWVTNGDKNSYGKSTVVHTYGESYATFKHDLVYQNWSNESGTNKPSPNPYAQSSFLFGKKGAWFQDISAHEGLCFVYTADKEFRIELQSRGKSDSYEDDDYWNVWVPPSSTKKTANLKFSSLPKAWWRSENATSLAKALTEMRGLAIQSPYMDRVHCYEEDVTNCDDVTYTNNIKLYMVGEYGKCPDYDSYELGKKQVEFEDGVLWKSSYGYGKVRTFFGDVDEYNFKSAFDIGDGSGWWYTYSDSSSAGKGKSTAVLANGDGYLKANLKLVYQWKKDAEGKVVPNPYPYAAFGFDWLADGNPGAVNLNELDSGLCLTYSATRNFDIALYSYRSIDVIHYSVAASETKKTINVKFNDFKEYSWNDNVLSLENALKRIQNFHILYMNDHVGDDFVQCKETDPSDCGSQTYTNEVKIYKLGKYGMCN